MKKKDTWRENKRVDRETQRASGRLRNEGKPWPFWHLRILHDMWINSLPNSTKLHSVNSIGYALERSGSSVDTKMRELCKNKRRQMEHYLETHYGDIGQSREKLHWTAREDEILLKVEEIQEALREPWLDKVATGMWYRCYPVTIEMLARFLGRSVRAVKTRYEELHRIKPSRVPTLGV